jgi:hypothetical protein
MKKSLLFIAFILLGLVVNAQKYECQTTDTLSANWLQAFQGIKFPNDLRAGIDYTFGDGGRTMTFFIDPNPAVQSAGYSGLARMSLADYENNASNNCFGLTSNDSLSGTGRTIGIAGCVGTGKLQFYSWGLVDKNDFYIDSTGTYTTKPIGITNHPIPNVYLNTLQLEPTDTTTAVLGTIVYKTSDNTFYGCISISAAKKWVALH